MRTLLRSSLQNLAAVAIGLALCKLLLPAVAAFSPAVAFRLLPYEHHVNVDGIELIVTGEVVADPVLGHRFYPDSGRYDKWGCRNASALALLPVVARRLAERAPDAVARKSMSTNQ